MSCPLPRKGVGRRFQGEYWCAISSWDSEIQSLREWLWVVSCGWLYNADIFSLLRKSSKSILLKNFFSISCANQYHCSIAEPYPVATSVPWGWGWGTGSGIWWSSISVVHDTHSKKVLLTFCHVHFYATIQKHWNACVKFSISDCSVSRCSVLGIFEARILKWVTISFSGGSSWPRDWTCIFCTAGRFFTDWTTREAPKRKTLEKILLPSLGHESF